MNSKTAKLLRKWALINQANYKQIKARWVKLPWNIKTGVRWRITRELELRD